MVFPDLNGWLILIRQEWLHTLGWLAALAVVFAVLARWMPCNPGMFWWKDRRAFVTDAVYWFLVPLFINVCRTLLLIAAVGLLLEGRTSMPLPVGSWSLWLQCLLVLVFQDVMLYWIHRAFHTRLGWGFHTVHHSSKVLDWTATVRFHPLNNLLAFSLADIAVLLLGFSREALIVLAPFNIAYSALVHANLSWTFGPLRHVLASPVFHRWHHTTEREGLNKNFASTFPILDLLFGTFYLPAGKLPEHFGNEEPDFPRGFWGQFVHPFWSRATAMGAWVRSRPGIAALMLVGVLGAGAMLGRWIDSRSQLLRQNAQLQQEVAQAWQQQAARVEMMARSAPLAAIRGVAISASGKCMATCATDGIVKVWDGAGQLKHTLVGHARPASCVAVSSDGRWIVSGSYDRTIKVWDVETGRVVRTLSGHTGGVLAVAISADGRFLVSGSGDFTGRVWDLHTGEEKAMLPSPPGAVGAVVAVAISADGQRVVTTFGTQVRVWDAGSGREQEPLAGHTDPVHAVAISADGRCVVSAGLDGNAIVWDVEQARPRCILYGHAGPVFSAAIDPDGTTVVTGGADGTVRVWNAATGRQLHLLTGHVSEVMAVAVDAGGHIVSGSRDGAVKLWPALKGGPRKLTRRPEPGAPVAAR